MTAGELAEKVGSARTRMYYHLNLLEQHGFVHVVDERLVSGINEKTYRATAKQFQVDRSLLGAVASEPEIAAVQASLLENVAEDLRTRARSGSPAVGTEDATVLVTRSFLKLSPKRYAKLRAALSALIVAYADAPEADGIDAQLAVAFFSMARSQNTGAPDGD